MRIQKGWGETPPYSPGYRTCFVQRGQTIIFLLCGGDKSTEDSDKVRAKELAQEI